jgi:hypothetical protein
VDEAFSGLASKWIRGQVIGTCSFTGNHRFTRWRLGHPEVADEALWMASMASLAAGSPAGPVGYEGLGLHAGAAGSVEQQRGLAVLEVE